MLEFAMCVVDAEAHGGRLQVQRQLNNTLTPEQATKLLEATDWHVPRATAQGWLAGQQQTLFAILEIITEVALLKRSPGKAGEESREADGRAHPVDWSEWGLEEFRALLDGEEGSADQDNGLLSRSLLSTMPLSPALSAMSVGTGMSDEKEIEAKSMNGLEEELATGRKVRCVEAMDLLGELWRDIPEDAFRAKVC